MKKMMVILALVLFSLSAFASELDGRSFNTPESIVKLIRFGGPVFPELKVPTCLAFNINTSMELSNYFKVGYYINSLATKKAQFTTDAGEVLPVIRAEVTLKHVASGEEIVSVFNCLVK